MHGNSILHYAAETGNLDLVRLLVTYSQVDVDAAGYRGYTALHWAAKYGYVEIARLLLHDAHAYVSPQSVSGSTPLHLAVKEAHDAMCNLLMGEYSASVNIPDKHHRTVKDLAELRTMECTTLQMVREAAVLGVKSAAVARLHSFPAAKSMLS